MNEKSIDLQALKATLAKNPELPLVFETEENPISTGYHVTEVKHAKINALDCGQGVDEWEEITIQLIDGPGRETDSHMQTSTFLHIIDKATASLGLNDDRQLFVEFGHQNGPMQKLNVVSIDQSQQQAKVLLAAKTASCKPFVRSQLTGAVGSGDACCGGAETVKNTSACCGSSANTSEQSGGQCCN